MTGSLGPLDRSVSKSQARQAIRPLLLMFPSDLHCVREQPTHPPQPQSERIEAVPPGLPVPSSLESRNTNFTFNIVLHFFEK